MSNHSIPSEPITQRRADYSAGFGKKNEKGHAAVLQVDAAGDVDGEVGAPIAVDVAFLRENRPTPTPVRLDLRLAELRSPGRFKIPESSAVIAMVGARSQVRNRLRGDLELAGVQTLAAQRTFSMLRTARPRRNSRISEMVFWISDQLETAAGTMGARLPPPSRTKP